MSFGENLQYLRRQEAMTQEALAERLEVSRQTVSKWESDSCYPEMEKLLQLRDLFRVDLDTLLLGSAEESQVEDTAQYNRFMDAFTWRVALSVGAIIAAVALVGGLMETVWGLSDMLCGAALLLVITVSVVVLVASGLQNDFFRKKHPMIADFYTQEERDAFHQRFVWLITGGVGAILFGLVLMLLFFSVFPEEEPYESYGTTLFLLLVAGAVVTLIYAGLQAEKYDIAGYNRSNNPSPAVRAREALIGTICGALMTLTAAIYVGLGLTRGTWRQDVWLFAVGGILCAVVGIILNPRRLEE